MTHLIYTLTSTTSRGATDSESEKFSRIYDNKFLQKFKIFIT